MANLEIQIGADSSDLTAELSKVEKQLRTLERRQELRIIAGLDTGDLDRRISQTRANLSGLQASMARTGAAAQTMSRNTNGAGNTLTQFSRIAQDAPFGIMGIGNNLTATAEAFSNLSRTSGGAGNALRAVAGSLMGSGGILLAVSLVTTALTVMSQQGLTVGDVFNKLTGRFDEFKKQLQDVNKEAAKESGAQVASAKAYVNAAQDINLSMSDRLIAVKKLQDEYPAYFGNLTKEQILNGNVSNTVKELTGALIAKAKAQGFANKIGEIAEKEVPLREKETEQIKATTAAIAELARIKKSNSEIRTTDRDRAREAAALGNIKRLRAELEETQSSIRVLNAETARWQAELNKSVELGIKTDFKVPPKAKVVKQLQEQVKAIAGSLKPVSLDSLITVDSGIFKSNINMGKDMDAFINRLRSLSTETRMVLFEWNSVLAEGFGSIGTSIGEALANGTSVLNAIGSSLLSSLSSLLSSMGDKLIAVGLTAVISGTALATMFTPAGIAAGVAAIALGTALKAGSGALGSMSKGMSSGSSGGGKVSAGNSVSSPTSSVSNGSSFAGGGNVVFEISGQSLVGVLSNTLNKNIKLGGAMPAI